MLWCLSLRQVARLSTKQDGVQALPEEASVCQEHCIPQVSRAKRPGAAEVAACFQEVERLPALVLTGAKDRRGPAPQGIGFVIEQPWPPCMLLGCSTGSSASSMRYFTQVQQSIKVW